MKIDCIICTYNRPERINQLILELINSKASFHQIIVVDSSDELNQNLNLNSQVEYIHSSHKNQPYQRFLGYSISTANFILFLDDDMEIANPNFFEIIEHCIATQNNLSGIAIHFEDKMENTALSKIPKSNLFSTKSTLKQLVNWITAYPTLGSGKFGLCGNKGKQPLAGGNTEWLSGGAFVANRDVLYQNFNFQLFDLFEQKLGMGEDGILGYTLSKIWNLVYLPDLLFYHNDKQQSHYSLNHKEFSKKVTYSRLFLSREKYRLDSKSGFYATAHFHWYTFCRFVGLIINQVFKFSSNRKEILKGLIAGWRLSLSFSFRNSAELREFWRSEAQKDIHVRKHI